jgi:hypothetical protein
MALLFIELCIFVILILLSYKKVAYPLSAIATIVFTCSIFLFTIFITSIYFGTLVDILGNYGQIYFMVFFRVALASLVSFVYFRDDYKYISLTIFLTTVIAIYTREWGWVK